jgi:hypothetical protein
MKLIDYEPDFAVDSHLTALVSVRSNPLFRSQGLERIQFFMEAV